VALSRTRVLEPDPTIKLERAVDCDGRACGLPAGRSANAVPGRGVHWHVVIGSSSKRERTLWVLGVRVPVSMPE